jgi:hypothetical protein
MFLVSMFHVRRFEVLSSSNLEPGTRNLELRARSLAFGGPRRLSRGDSLRGH